MQAFLLAIVVLSGEIHGLPTLISQSTEDNVVASFVTKIYRHKDDCLLVLGHDYKYLPLAMSNSLNDNGRLYGASVAVKWDKSTPAPPINPGTNDNFEYWFSWLERPTSRHLGNCLFVVLIYHDNNYDPLLKYVASVVRLDPRKDRVMYYSQNSDVKPAILESEFLYQMGAQYDEATGYVQIANKCHFCDGGNPLTVPRGMYSVQSGIVLSELNPFPDYSTDLNKKFLNITWIVESNPEEIKEQVRQGLPVFPYLWFMVDLAHLFNFDWQSRRPVPVPGYADEQRLPDGNYTGVIGAVQRRETLVTASYTTDNTVRVGDSSDCFYSSYITFGRRLPQPLFSWTSIFKPYTSGMWSLIILSASISTLVFFYLLKIQYSISYPFHSNEHPPRSHLLYSLRFVWSGLIEENPNLIPTCSSLRMLICFWWLFCDLIVLGYEAKFFAFLVTPDLEVLPNDYKELAQTPGWKWGGISNLSSYINMALERSEIDYHQIVLLGMEEGRDMMSCLMKAINEDFACLGSADIITPTAYLRMDLEGNLPVEIIDDSSLRVIGGAISPKYSILTPAFGRFQYRLIQSGIFDDYMVDFSYVIALNNLKFTRAEKLLYKLSMELRISQIKGPLALLCIFLLFSFGVFLGELINYRVKNEMKL